MSALPIAPEKLAESRQQILKSLQKRHYMTPNDAWPLLGIGVIALVIVSWVLGIVAMVLHAMLSGWESAWPTHRFFALSLLIFAVVLVIQERRTRGGFFSFAASDIDLRRDRDNTAEYFIRRSKTHLATFAEYAGWPGRAIIAGVRGLLGIRETSLDTILPEAADVLTRMFAIDEGVKIPVLAPPGTDPMQLMPILKWLDTHDYIGFSTNGEKVWISSRARKRFSEDGIIVPRAIGTAPIDPAKAQATDESGKQGPIELA